jgi:hypothetical protein
MYSFILSIRYIPQLSKIISRLVRSVAVFGVYLENGKQSMLQPIHFRKDLFENFPEMYML